MPGTYNFDGAATATNRPVYVGDDRELYLTVEDDGVPVDYTTGYTFLAEIAADRASTTEETATFTVTAPEPGVLLLRLPASEAANLGPLIDPETGTGLAQWDLQITQADPARVFTLLSGKVKLQGDVSRA